jgi:hypothetical protein
LASEAGDSALHGQLVINRLIESILKHVDIPLTLQEIEGDAVFLYAAHPGSDEAWCTVVEEVSRKLAAFFGGFVAEAGIMMESTPCLCAACRNVDQLGLKIIVRSGEAVFHQIAGRPQVSGSDVILAHRLLKNSLASNEYLLLTEAAYAAMSAHLPGRFDPHQETYEGFGTVQLRVRDLTEEFLAARDSVYTLGESELDAAVGTYTSGMRPGILLAIAIQQLRKPIRRFSWREKFLMLFESVVATPLALLYYPRDSQTDRGARQAAHALIVRKNKRLTIE